MRTSTLLAAIFMAASSCRADPVVVRAQTTAKGVEEASSTPILNAQMVQGCFSSQGVLKFNSTPQWNSKSSCAHDICYASGKKVAATSGGNECYCGDKYPPKSTLVDDKKCNSPCAGYDWDACGGINYWTVYNTGVMLSVEYSSDDEASASASASASATKPAVVTVSGSTTVVTQTSAAEETETSKKSSSNTAGIAAGVVVAVVAVAGIVGGVFFFLRRRRNKEIEEEHHRNAAVNAFIHGSKPPSSSGGYSISDSRLDPVMAQRRLSDGSIADNQDYSRKILRVTNA